MGVPEPLAAIVIWCVDCTKNWCTLRSRDFNVRVSRCDFKFLIMFQSPSPPDASLKGKGRQAVMKLKCMDPDPESALIQVVFAVNDLPSRHVRSHNFASEEICVLPCPHDVWHPLGCSPLWT